MLYCPKCRCEYRDGFATCIDCDTPLVAELPSAEAAVVAVADDPEAAYIMLCTVEDQQEAVQLQEALESAGVPVKLEGRLPSPYAQYTRHNSLGNNVLSRPGWELWVPPNMLEQVEDVIRQGAAAFAEAQDEDAIEDEPIDAWYWKRKQERRAWGWLLSALGLLVAIFIAWLWRRG